MSALFRVADLETVYRDRHRALTGVSLAIDEGEVVAVLGPNGSGKTTLLRTVAGLLRGQPRQGTITFAGERIEGKGPEAVARRGIAYVSEDRGLFRELTVAENLELGLWGRRDRSDLGFVHALFPVLGERAEQRAETLSGGEQQMLALARALLRRPRLLLLDEPSLGLAPVVARAAFRALEAVRARGTAILLVEQNARLALAAATRALVLEAGRVVLEGSSADVAARKGWGEAELGPAGTSGPNG